MLLYITVMLKPLMPIMSDWYEHEFNSIAHEIHVHLVYGHDHVEKKVAESNSEDDHHSDHDLVKSEDNVPFHVLLEEDKNLNNSTHINKKFKVCNYDKPLPVFISPEGPPPKFT
jgi:hypothetical protein